MLECKNEEKYEIHVYLYDLIKKYIFNYCITVSTFSFSSKNNFFCSKNKSKRILSLRSFEKGRMLYNIYERNNFVHKACFSMYSNKSFINTLKYINM